MTHPFRLLTQRLVLREFERDDWRAVQAYQSDPRYLRYYAWSARDDSDVREFVDSFMDRQKEELRAVYQLAITLPSQHSRPIGNCGVRVNSQELRD